MKKFERIYRLILEDCTKKSKRIISEAPLFDNNEEIVDELPVINKFSESELKKQVAFTVESFFDRMKNFIEIRKNDSMAWEAIESWSNPHPIYLYDTSDVPKRLIQLYKNPALKVLIYWEFAENGNMKLTREYNNADEVVYDLKDIDDSKRFEYIQQFWVQSCVFNIKYQIDDISRPGDERKVWSDSDLFNFDKFFPPAERDKIKECLVSEVYPEFINNFKTFINGKFKNRLKETLTKVVLEIAAKLPDSIKPEQN